MSRFDDINEGRSRNPPTFGDWLAACREQMGRRDPNLLTQWRSLAEQIWSHSKTDSNALQQLHRVKRNAALLCLDCLEAHGEHPLREAAVVAAKALVLWEGRKNGPCPLTRGELRDLCRAVRGMEDAAAPLAEVRLGVLLVIGREGVATTLTLQLLPEGSGEWLAAPEMAFHDRDIAFVASQIHSRDWIRQQGWWPEWLDVRWRLEPPPGMDRLPFDGICGNSFGGAFVLGLAALLVESGQVPPDAEAALCLKGFTDLRTLAVTAGIDFLREGVKYQEATVDDWLVDGGLHKVGGELEKYFGARERSDPRIGLVVFSVDQEDLSPGNLSSSRDWTPQPPIGGVTFYQHRSARTQEVAFAFAARPAKLFPIVEVFLKDEAWQIEQYRAWLRHLVGDIRPVGLHKIDPSRVSLPIEGAYVPLNTARSGSIERGHPSRFVPDPQDRIVPFEQAFAQFDHKTRGLIAYGEPGSGKTTGGRRLAWLLLSGRASPESLGLPRDIIPIWVPLRELRDFMRKREPIRAWLRALEIQPEAGGRPIHPGEALLNSRHPRLWICDGLDEVRDSKERQRLCEQLMAWVEGHPHDRVLITSRYFGQQAADLKLDFPDLSVCPLGEADQVDFVRAYFRLVHGDRPGADPDRLLALIRERQRSPGGERQIGDIVTNPLLLSIVCFLYHVLGELPEHRCDLYATLVDELLAGWKSELATSERETALHGLRRIAWTLQTGKIRESARQTDLAAAVAPLVCGAGRRWADGPAFLDDMRLLCGLLAFTGGDDRLGFLHLTLQEHLAAGWAVHHAPGEATTLAARVTDPQSGATWREVVLLAIAQGDTAFRTTLFDALLERRLDETDSPYLRRCLREAADGAVPAFAKKWSRPELDGWRRHHLLAAFHDFHFFLPEWRRDAEDRLARERARGIHAEVTTIEALEAHLAELEADSVRLIEAAESLFHGCPEARDIALEILARAGRDISGYPGGADLRIEPKSGIALVRVPPGIYRTGDKNEGDNPPRDFTVAGDLWIGKYPVTHAEYRRFLDSGAAGDAIESTLSNDPRFTGARQPVVEVNFAESEAFCAWAGGCLPSEEEWECACRAGSTTAYCFGDSETDLEDYAWFRENAEGRTHEVGQKKPNAWSLYDGHGNVWEWCDDWFDKSGSSRVSRGGGWNGTAGSCRSACRGWYLPGGRIAYVGFRLALSPVRRPEPGNRGKAERSAGPEARRGEAEPPRRRWRPGAERRRAGGAMTEENPESK